MVSIVDVLSTCYGTVIGPIFMLSPMLLIPRWLGGELGLPPAGQVTLFSLVGLGAVVAVSAATNVLSYRYLKARTLKRQRWDLNICCGRTDGGGINADIMRHADVPRYVPVEDIYALPFDDNQFEHVLCSHTIEHVDDPERFLVELQRVGRQVTLVIPPLWDVTAAFNLLEHRHVFFVLTKEHRQLPRYVKLPLAEFVQKRLGQIMHA